MDPSAVARLVDLCQALQTRVLLGVRTHLVDREDRLDVSGGDDPVVLEECGPWRTRSFQAACVPAPLQSSPQGTVVAPAAMQVTAPRSTLGVSERFRRHDRIDHGHDPLGSVIWKAFLDLP
ncbi:hypothetical protein [Sanguibacter antarcticus]|uniref:Uncharacterized protein n=1 Tax=Sanguibacter antarcticus TaxID=372484 RepID=A0A2A9E2F1_9MICO|nr:hypothetical protein [Sanguibacter antarcticus]PFG33024.1 hypothetical protein ATL42_0876 [Sanguibacter antarcticus]